MNGITTHGIWSKAFEALLAGHSKGHAWRAFLEAAQPSQVVANSTFPFAVFLVRNNFPWNSGRYEDREQTSRFFSFVRPEAMDRETSQGHWSAPAVPALPVDGLASGIARTTVDGVIPLADFSPFSRYALYCTAQHLFALPKQIARTWVPFKESMGISFGYNFLPVRTICAYIATKPGDVLVAVRKFVSCLHSKKARLIVAARTGRTHCSVKKQSPIFSTRNFLGSIVSHLLAPPRFA